MIHTHTPDGADHHDDLLRSKSLKACIYRTHDTQTHIHAQTCTNQGGSLALLDCFHVEQGGGQRHTAVGKVRQANAPPPHRHHNYRSSQVSFAEPLNTRMSSRLACT